MKAIIEGQFLENGSYHSNKLNQDVVFTTLLVGNSTLQVQGVQQSPTVKRLDTIKMNVDLRAFGSQITATYLPN